MIKEKKSLLGTKINCIEIQLICSKPKWINKTSLSLQKY